jgi:hypothetical protein
MLHYLPYVLLVEMDRELIPLCYYPCASDHKYILYRPVISIRRPGGPVLLDEHEKRRQRRNTRPRQRPHAILERCMILPHPRAPQVRAPNAALCAGSLHEDAYGDALLDIKNILILSAVRRRPFFVAVPVKIDNPNLVEPT